MRRFLLSAALAGSQSMADTTNLGAYDVICTTNLMLMQADPIEAGGAIRLLPAWPRDWDVSFKLHAPGKTTVECVYWGGEIVSLRVMPESREKDVQVPQWAGSP